MFYPLGKKKLRKKLKEKEAELGGDHHPQPLVRPWVKMHLNLPKQ